MAESRARPRAPRSPDRRGPAAGAAAAPDAAHACLARATAGREAPPRAGEAPSAATRSRRLNRCQRGYDPDTVRRQRLLWPLFLTLAGPAWVAAHAVAYRLTAPEHAEGGAYSHYVPTSLALCIGLAVCLLSAGALAGRPRDLAPFEAAWLFGVSPVLGFALAEGSGHSASALGALLVMQLPFALLALVLARGLFVLARGLAKALAWPQTSPLPALELLERLPETGARGGRRPAGARRQRAPPLLHGR